MKKRTGWANYMTFGLRSAWVEMYLEHPEDWKLKNLLGSCQKTAMEKWIKTAGLEDNIGKHSQLFWLFKKNGILDTTPWEILWINVCHRFATAQWYARNIHIGKEYSTTELAHMLQNENPHLSARTHRNASTEIIGLLKHTPVGDQLGQGIMQQTRPLRVTRMGLAEPSSLSILHSLLMLLLETERTVLHFHEDLLWPSVIFGFPKERMPLILASIEAEWLIFKEDRLCSIAIEELKNVSIF